MKFVYTSLLMHIFPFLAALAGMRFGSLVIGIQRAADHMQRPRWAVPVTILVALLAFLPQSISLVRLYPHLLSYYSESVGGIPGAARLGLETTYWCETYAAALPYLNEHTQPGVLSRLTHRHAKRPTREDRPR